MGSRPVNQGKGLPGVVNKHTRFPFLSHKNIINNEVVSDASFVNNYLTNDHLAAVNVSPTKTKGLQLLVLKETIMVRC